MTWLPDPEEVRLNLLKDGGRLVMYGGDPYEDDLEPAEPSVKEAISANQGREADSASSIRASSAG